MNARPRSYLPYVVLILLVVFTAGLLITRARRKPKAPQTVAQPVTPVAVTPVSLGSMMESVPVTGTLRAQREAAILPQINARITSVNVLEGDTVSAGQVLVTLDSTDAQAQVRQAQAGVFSAQAAVRTARAQWQAAQQRLVVLKSGARTEERQIAASRVEQAESALRQAQANLARRKSLFGAGAISREELDAAQTAYDTARTNRNAARDSLQLTRKGPRPEEVAAGESEVNAARQQVNAAEAGVSQAQAALARAQELLSYTTIRSPLSGVVYERKVDPGEISSTMGDPMLRVADLNSVYLEATVPGRLAPQVNAGQTVQLTLRGDGRSYQGKVLKLVPVANPASRDFLARISLPRVAAISRPGLYAEGQIIVRQRQSVPVVSKDALIERGGRQVVYVVAAGTEPTRPVQERPVQVGMTDGQRAEIVSGLQPGELIVTAGAQSLQNGTEVSLQQLSGGQ